MSQDQSGDARPGDPAAPYAADFSVRRPAVAAAVLLAVLAALTAVVALHPAPLPVDEWWVETVTAWRSGASTDIARLLNQLGRFPLSGVIVLALAAVLWRLRGRADAILFIVAEVAATGLTNLIKLAISRPRPLDGLVDTVSASFPSGHSSFAAVTAVLLVGILCPPGRRWPWALLAGALAFTMAWSRSYLLVHWFTDVVAGLAAGAGVGFAALAWRARRLNRGHNAARRTPREATRHE